MGALETAIEKIDASVAQTAAAFRAERGTIRPQIMVDQPWRIRRAMDGLCWRENGETYPELLVRCRKQIANMEALGRAGHWAFSRDALLALYEAEAALEILTGTAVLTGEAA